MDFASCRNCGAHIEVSRQKFCGDGCREEFKKTLAGTPEARHKVLLRVLEAECVPPSDMLYHPEFYFSLIVDNKCTYCDGPLSQTGHGLDRIKNPKGHRCFNVLAACGWCNKIKGDDVLSFEEMIILRPLLMDIFARRH
jgi:uncharacterized Zn-finger protein